MERWNSNHLFILVYRASRITLLPTLKSSINCPAAVFTVPVVFIWSFCHCAVVLAWQRQCPPTISPVCDQATACAAWCGHKSGRVVVKIAAAFVAQCPWCFGFTTVFCAGTSVDNDQFQRIHGYCYRFLLLFFKVRGILFNCLWHRLR